MTDLPVTDLLLMVIAVVLLAAEVYFVILMIQVKKSVGTFQKNMEEKITPVVEEANLTLRSVRKIVDNIADVTDDIKGLSTSVGEIGHTVGVLNKAIGSAGTAATVRAVSLQAGAKAAVQYLITNLMRKGENK